MTAPPSRTLLIPSSEPRVQLSAKVAVSPTAAKTKTTTPTVGLLLLHAYPRLGGSSADLVLTSIFHAARKSSGAFAVVLRYDQRGVGGSGGARALWGGPDAADAGAVAARLLDGSLHASIPRVDRLYAVGYSWGAALAALGTLPSVAGWVGVSPPLGGLAGAALRTGRAASALAAHPATPGLVILGDRDQFASVRGVESVLARVNAQREAASEGRAPSPPATRSDGGSGGGGVSRVELKVVDGADHFWGAASAWCDSWGTVAGLVLDWIGGVEEEAGTAGGEKTG
jgi:alpha/beta superfamily hydrolase